MSISFLVGQMRVRLAGKTDVGQVRALNEDNLLVAKDKPLCVVADGMGGHACGEVASRIAVETIDRFYRDTEADVPSNWPFPMPKVQTELQRMTTAVKLANSRIYWTASQDTQKKGMGCTIDAIFFDKNRTYIGHVGDSRVYRLRNGHLEQITEDHSLLNDYRKIRDMSTDEIENFPHKNVVVRGLGLSEHVSVEILMDSYQLGDLFLLCSDGLNDMLSDEQIANLLIRAQDGLDAAATALIDSANAAGGRDNITVLLAQVEAP